MLYFRPQLGAVGDAIPFYHRGEYHLFYLIAPPVENSQERMCTSWGHIRSKDLLSWTELPHALEPSGQEGSADQSACWTGSVIEHDDMFHVFYTGGSVAGKSFRQTICQATSPDLIRWQKNSDNPILVPDDRWYESTDWRDPFVYWQQKDECFYMLIAARNKTGWPPRRGCLALATSRDLQSWTIQPPAWEPYIGHVLECPERFRIGAREYLAFSTYSEENVTHYRLIRETGEIVSPPLADQIETRFYYAAKGLSDDSRRITFGWIPEVAGGTDEGEVLWGGNLGIPHTLTPRADGTLAVYYPDSYRKLIGTQFGFDPITQLGDWQSAPDGWRASAPGGAAYKLLERQPQAFYLTVRLALEGGTHSAGLILNADRDLSWGYFLELENASRILRLFKYPRGESLPKRKVLVQRVLPFPVNEVYLELFYAQGMLTVFVNQSAAMSARMYETAPCFGLFVQSGKAIFQGLAGHSLKLEGSSL